MQSGSGSDNVLKLAIEQYEQIIKLEPDSVDDHLLLGRLYHAEQRTGKAEERIQDRGEAGSPIPKKPSPLWPISTTKRAMRRGPRETLSSVPDAARSAKLYSALGYTYEQQKDYKKAIDGLPERD